MSAILGAQERRSPAFPLTLTTGDKLSLLLFLFVRVKQEQVVSHFCTAHGRVLSGKPEHVISPSKWPFAWGSAPLSCVVQWVHLTQQSASQAASRYAIYSVGNSRPHQSTYSAAMRPKSKPTTEQCLVRFALSINAGIKVCYAT